MKAGGVTWLGETRYAVVGKKEPLYYVDLNEDPSCWCLDSENRGAKATCYHVLAAAMVHQEEDVLLALAALLQKMEKTA